MVRPHTAHHLDGRYALLPLNADFMDVYSGGGRLPPCEVGEGRPLRIRLCDGRPFCGQGAVRTARTRKLLGLSLSPAEAFPV